MAALGSDQQVNKQATSGFFILVIVSMGSRIHLMEGNLEKKSSGISSQHTSGWSTINQSAIGTVPGISTTKATGMVPLAQPGISWPVLRDRLPISPSSALSSTQTYNGSVVASKSNFELQGLQSYSTPSGVAWSYVPDPRFINTGKPIKPFSNSPYAPNKELRAKALTPRIEVTNL